MYPSTHVFSTQVVGAVIVDAIESPTHFLAAQRAYPKALRGLWEFPGGKVESTDSTCQDALKRECSEELGVDLCLHQELVGPHAQGWPLKDSAAMRVWVATIISGDVQVGAGKGSADHLELRWIPLQSRADTVRALTWIPADLPIVETLLDGTIFHIHR